ncbi:MAG: MBL fold metallo-hydrolase [Clostridiales bacterium]|nr:MBL fold metallo-hydrolase [Clostridiales bacterium]
MAKVCQLFSGSSGNSILLSSLSHTFLVDIGVSAKRCEKALQQLGVDPDNIDAIFVTHEHRDHCSGVRVFASRHKTPVFASPLSLAQMRVMGFVDDSVSAYAVEGNIQLGKTEIIPFRQSHDSVDCLGYRFNFKDGRSAGICTDTGYVTDSAKSVLKSADLVFIESNHEIAMLNNGPYPYCLKQRILGEQGHLSNFACGEYIKELAQSGTTRFVLSHLSRENNTPDLARQSALCALDEIGFKEEKDFRLFVSQLENNSRGIVL